MAKENGAERHECKSFKMRDRYLVCAECGEMSKSDRWRTNVWGQKLAAEITAVEAKVSAMTEKQKDALLSGIFDAQGMIRYDAELSPEQRAVCAKRRLRRGPSPLSVKALKPLVPNELRETLAQAKMRYEEAEALTIQSFTKWGGAEADRSKFAQQVRGSGPLTDAGIKKRDELDAAVESTKADFLEAEKVEEQARVELKREQDRIEAWAYAEKDRREEAAREEKAKLEKPVSLSLTERLSKLRAKLT